MKKFAQTADLGGGPIYKTDLAAMFNLEMWDAMESILAAIASQVQGCIMNGVTITDHSGTTFDNTAGVVYLNGTFMRVPAITGASYPQYIQEDTSVSDIRVFANGTSNTIATTRIAKYANTIPGSGQYIAITTTGAIYPFGVKNPGGIRIENIFPMLKTSWTNLSLINNWGNGGFVSTVARYRINNGKIRISGGINRSSGSSSIFANITGLNGLSISTGYTKVFPAAKFSDGSYIALQVAWASSTSISLGLLSASNSTDYFFSVEFAIDDLDA